MQFCFIILTYLVPVLFTFIYRGAKIKKKFRRQKITRNIRVKLHVGIDRNFPPVLLFVRSRDSMVSIVTRRTDESWFVSR